MKNKWLSFIIFTAVMTLFLYQTFQLEGLLNTLILPFFMLFLFAIFDQYKLEKPIQEKTLTQKDLLSLVFVLVGFVLSFGLHFYASMPHIVASALTGMVGYIFLREHEKEVYCGSFAGMISLTIINPIFIILMVTILPIVYLMSRSTFNGLGGKLGTIAFVSSLMAVSLLPTYQIISPNELEPMSITVVIGIALATMFIFEGIKKIYPHSNVLISASLSLLAFFILSLIPSGLLYLPIVFIASFIGMTDQSRIKGLSFLIISPIIMSVLFMMTRPVYTGIGGKAGLTAFIAVLITLALLNTFEIMFYKQKKSST